MDFPGWLWQEKCSFCELFCYELSELPCDILGAIRVARDDVFSYKFCSCSEPQNPGRYTVVKGSMAVATPNFGGDLFSEP